MTAPTKGIRALGLIINFFWLCVATTMMFFFPIALVWYAKRICTITIESTKILLPKTFLRITNIKQSKTCNNTLLLCFYHVTDHRQIYHYYRSSFFILVICIPCNPDYFKHIFIRKGAIKIFAIFPDSILCHDFLLYMKFFPFHPPICFPFRRAVSIPYFVR